MPSEHYKRYRMQIDLRRVRLPNPRVPRAYRWVPWRRLLLERHADVKWQAFRNDLDGRVFPCLSDLEGCRRLMTDITSQSSFCPNATWMLTYQPDSEWPAVDCGSIQGILRRGGIGAIQNVGVIPEHRGQGLGRALILQALHGFRFSGMHYSLLEVTAGNRPAIGLYQSLGFEIVEVLFRDAVTGETIEDCTDSIEIHKDAALDTEQSSLQE